VKHPTSIRALAAAACTLAAVGCAHEPMPLADSLSEGISRGTGVIPSWAAGSEPEDAQSLRHAAADPVPDPLDEREAVRLALERSPELARMIAKAEAMRHEAVDMSLPMNPMLNVGSGVPVGSMGTVPVLAMVMGQIDELWTRPARSAVARDTYAAMLLDLGAQAVSMAAKARAMWHEVQLRDEELLHAEHDERITARLVAIAREQVAVGEADLSMLQEATAEYSDAHHRTSKAREARDAARLALMAMMGRADAPLEWRTGSPDPAAQAAVHLPLGSEVQLLDALAANRLDVRAAEARLRAAEASLKLARLTRLRQIQLGAGYERDMERMEAIMFNANIELPVFNDGSARIGRAAAEMRAAALDAERVRQAAIVQLRTALSRARAADERRDITMSAVVTPGHEAFARAQAAVDAGEGTLARALDVEHSLNHARLELTDLERERRMMRIELAQASGFLPLEVSP
jgi:cobalt-zinc-cadmium efflux system outer membrane protein